MRNTLIIGLLLCLPVAVLLASASLAVLADKLRRRSSRSAGPGTVLPDADGVAGRVLEGGTVLPDLPAEHRVVEGSRTRGRA